MKKKILLGLATVFVLIQFIRPEKNNSNIQTNHIANKYMMPQEVKEIFAKACDDCHSNNTRYPWYSNFQPVAWWLDDHVKDGKRHLNMSELGARRINLQNQKLEEIIEMVDKKEMPLNSYTWIHTDSKLTEVERNWITTWAKSAMDYIKANYPADSLVMPKR